MRSQPLAGPWWGFPPGSRHLLLPTRPRAAARHGLALYQAVERHQRLALAGGRLLLRTRLERLLGRIDVPAGVDTGWWEHLATEVAAPLVGPPAAGAFLVLDDRVNALLLDGDGRPLVFVKARRVDDPGHYSSELEPRLLAAVTDPPPRSFRAPALLTTGEREGWTYQLFEPLPPGLHRRPPPDVSRVTAISDELRERASAVVRPPGQPDGYVACHGDFTPRNLRVASDGEWWLFDWEYAHWGPRLEDELRYWTTELAARGPRAPERAARRLASLLQARGTDAEIAEALDAYQHVTPAEAAIRAQLGHFLRTGEESVRAGGVRARLRPARAAARRRWVTVWRRVSGRSDTFWDNQGYAYLRDEFLRPTVDGVDHPSRAYVRRHLEQQRDAVVLDIPCGPGIDYEGLVRDGAPISWIGMDASDTALDVMRDRFPEAQVHKGDITSIPLADETVDVVLCRHILEHLDDWRPAIREALRVARREVLVVLFREPTHSDRRRLGWGAWDNRLDWDEFAAFVRDLDVDVDAVRVPYPPGTHLPDGVEENTVVHIRKRRRGGSVNSRAQSDRGARPGPGTS